MKISFIVIDHPMLAIDKKQDNMIISPGPGFAQIIYEVGKI